MINTRAPDGANKNDSLYKMKQVNTCCEAADEVRCCRGESLGESCAKPRRVEAGGRSPVFKEES